MEHTKCLIIGSGPAGYTAAIYASRANLKPILYSGLQPGGQLTTTTEVENFPGYPQGVDGNQMMMDMRDQALRFGADIRDGSITSFSLKVSPREGANANAKVSPRGGDLEGAIATADDGCEIEATTVIIATGASAKYLGLADEEKYRGMGVSACATCDGFFYRKKTVAVVGGGDTACEDALYLSHLAKKVYLIVRKPFLRASKVMQQRVMEAENIEILFETRAIGLYGEDGVEGARLESTNPDVPEAKYTTIDIDGFFLAIGHKPNSDLFRQYVETDEAGFIKTIPGTPKTNVPGVFAAGDVADPVYRQAIVAAASGCKAAMEAERFISSL